ncbi:molybdenum cofactor guanylyltransferase [Demequina mangrovi]|uniref:Molybdopterin-guanine dinucleotide biosynthesis protein A n=1 Tax=Demequina mangrovi TaxID=1043493 RepID=A0A1H6V9R9_9MICO|nr:NTP transferase domain-containing protein [Demequina mangrovi]SEI97042.1 Molybdopterin-guanine dinucleotide biosynthesis protein A [Demequina mangrovi]
MTSAEPGDRSGVPAESAPHARWDAVIVAGGRGSRLDGESKPDLVVGGEPLLDRTLAAVAGADAAVVVGGPRREGARWTVENPPGSGPAAALAAGLAELARDREPASVTVVLGVDTPLAAVAVPRLIAAAGPSQGAWLVDLEGIPQYLVAAYPTGALSARCGEDLGGASLRRLVAGLDMREITDGDGLAKDVDTWDDVRFWKERLG